jgi:intron-binding protein aquarius
MLGCARLQINEKFRENVPAWDALSAHSAAVPGLFTAVTGLKSTERGGSMRMHEKVAYLLFAINAFQSLENEGVRGQVLRLVSLPLWHALSRGRLQVWNPRPPACFMSDVTVT